MRMIFIGQFLAIPVEPVQVNVLQTNELSLVFELDIKTFYVTLEIVQLTSIVPTNP